MQKKLPVYIVLACFISLVWSTAVLADSRPSNWAQPLKVEGVPNLHKVTDDIYRSAQPTEKGFKNLEAMGIKSVLNLRNFHSDRSLLNKTKLTYYSEGINTWALNSGDVLKALVVIYNAPKPILVHCQHGADRTGTIIAVWRMINQDWTRTEALNEMTKGGFGFHSVWDNLVDYIEDYDRYKLEEALTKKGVKF